MQNFVAIISDGIRSKVAAAAAAAAATVDANARRAAPGSYEVDVKVGGEVLRLEIDAGITPPEVAAEFCEGCARPRRRAGVGDSVSERVRVCMCARARGCRHWPRIVAAMGSVMSAEDAGRVTQADCARLFVEEIASQMIRQG